MVSTDPARANGSQEFAISYVRDRGSSSLTGREENDEALGAREGSYEKAEIVPKRPRPPTADHRRSVRTICAEWI
jgi:hypothetical protein